MGNQPSLQDLRSRISHRHRRRSTIRGTALFAVVFVIYATTLSAVYLSSAPGWKLAAALANGLAIGLLFIVGHDACHDSLTASHRLNGVLGRLALLPSLHPRTAWIYSHNGLHHRWTNLKGCDPVYAPLTLPEYRALGWWGRLGERFGRSVFGVGFLYFWTIWWQIQMWPNATLRRAMRRTGHYRLDRTLVALFLSGHLLFAWAATMDDSREAYSVASSAFFAILVPFATWNWLMGFITFQHHTHPSVPWFEDRKEWSHLRGQLHGTANIAIPSWVNRLLLNIMEHTAHHIDPSIPLHGLRESQAQLNPHARRHEWNLKECLRTFSSCKLYDYRRHQWLDYQGRPTSAAGLQSTALQ